MGVVDAFTLVRAGGLARPATTTILGYFPSSFPDSNEPFCMFNHQRELTLRRLTAAPTATSCAYF